MTHPAQLLDHVGLHGQCGGGGGAGLVTTLAGVGSGGTGSLIVDGMRRNDSGASYATEAQQGMTTPMPMTGVMLGQSLELAYDAGGNITSVLISPKIVGTVTASNITVLDTPISADNDAASGPVTSFVGYAALANVKIGDRIDAHGPLKFDSQGKSWLQATLIMQLPTASGVRITGIDSQYNAGAASFALGNQTVTIWSNSAPVGDVISATAIRVKRPPQVSVNVTLPDAIANYLGNSSFQLRNVAVDASAASIAPSSASLGNDKYVVISCSYDLAANKLTASSVTVFTDTAPTSVEVHGMVVNFVSTASFTLRGVVIDASGATFIGDSAAQLANGVFLEVHGTVSNNLVHATAVQFVAFTPGQAPNGSFIEVGGMLTAYDPKSGTFSMSMANGGSISGNMGASAAFLNGNAANLVVGQSVSIAGVFNNSAHTGTEVNFQSALPPSPGIMQMSGIAANVTTASFMLNGLTIQRNSVAIQGGGMMGGSLVNVSVHLTGSQYLAAAISLLDN